MAWQSAEKVVKASANMAAHMIDKKLFVFRRVFYFSLSFYGGGALGALMTLRLRLGFRWTGDS